MYRQAARRIIGAVQATCSRRETMKAIHLTQPRRLALLGGLASFAVSAAAAAGTCTATADLMLEACGYDGQDDLLVGRARCLQVGNATEREECIASNREEFADHAEECDAQHAERVAVCAQLGEARHDPDYDRDLFDPDYANPSNPNRYFPLTPGSRWVFRSNEEERITVEVLNRTKGIEGLRCIVVLDQVFDTGIHKIKEKTNDWYCQAKNGDVHYVGEETGEYRTFPLRDDPPVPELVDIDGSFKSGRDGSKGGLIMLGTPVAGAVYREEYALGEAEDMAEVLSTSYSFGEDAALDELVPQALAQALCAGDDCVVTRNTSQIEPGVFEHKYYARDIGVFLETAPDTGEVVRLVSCNVDALCNTLPQP
jgi:hypothetical protein